MRKFRVLSLEKGISKNGRPWGRVMLRTIPASSGKVARVVEFWVDVDVIYSAVSAGVVVDSDAFVSADFNEDGRILVSAIKPVTSSNASAVK